MFLSICCRPWLGGPSPSRPCTRERKNILCHCRRSSVVDRDTCTACRYYYSSGQCRTYRIYHNRNSRKCFYYHNRNHSTPTSNHFDSGSNPQLHQSTRSEWPSWSGYPYISQRLHDADYFTGIGNPSFDTDCASADYPYYPP